MSSIDIAVAIPTYRRPKQFQRALESVLAQSHAPTSIVVGDDGSQEEVRHIVSSYGDSRIHYYPRVSSRRMTENWDFVMRWATNGLVALLEDDNLWRPAHLQHAIELFARYPEAGLYHCAHDEARDREGELRIYKNQFPPWHPSLAPTNGGVVGTDAIVYDALECGSVNSSTVVLRRAILDGMPLFDHRYLMGMDTMMWTRIALKAQVVYGPWADVVYTYHDHNVSVDELATGRATVHTRAARRLILREACDSGALTADAFEKALRHLPPNTAAPIVILAADPGQPDYIRAAASHAFSRRTDIRRFSGHLRLAALLGFGVLRYSAHLDHIRYKWNLMVRRHRRGLSLLTTWLRPPPSSQLPGSDKPMLIEAAEKPLEYYACERQEMLAFVPRSARQILDVGCGEGAFGRRLKQRDPDIQMFGIEVEAKPASRAAAWYDRVVAGAFPDDLPADLPLLDCAVFNDVLEHLIDPWAALRALHPRLGPDAVVVASVPNVRYLPVLFRLLVKGTFAYTATGVLDRTHLRFFTKSSIVELFETTGYRVDTIRGINALDRWQIKILRKLLPAFANDVRFIEYAVVARRNASDI